MINIDKPECCMALSEIASDSHFLHHMFAQKLLQQIETARTACEMPHTS